MKSPSTEEQQYIVYASLHADLDSGYIWLPNLYPGSARSVLKIKNVDNRKSVFAEILLIDDNFKNQYEKGQTSNAIQWDKVAIINSWYRNKLGIAETKSNVTLKFTKSGSWRRICACLDHPNISVRISTWLALISMVLGLVSLVIAFK